MSILIQITLWAFAALSALAILMALTEAKKPRQEIDPAAGCLAAGFLLVCALPVILILAGDYSHRAKILASVLAGGVVYSTAQAVREVHGVRGPRTPVSTMVAVLLNLAEIAVLAMLIPEV